MDLPGLLQRLLGSGDGATVDLNVVDPITRLPTRVGVINELKHCLSKSRGKHPVAIAIIDFSNVSGLVEGRAPGERDLLMRLGKLLRTSVPERHVVGHLRNREFAVIACDAPVAEVEHMADRIIEAVRNDKTVEAEKRYIATMVGIGFSSKGDGTASQLMGLADIALHYAEATGRGVHAIVDRVRPAAA